MMTTALVAAGASYAVPTFAQNATARESRAAYDIPAQELSRALVQFSNATGMQLFYDANIVRGKSSPGVSGSMSHDEALQRLLAGNGLSFNVRGNTVTIADRVAAAHTQLADDGSILLDTITISGQADRNAASGSGFMGTPDWVYETPASVSVVSQQAIRSDPGRDTKELFEGVPGVLASGDAGQDPGLNVNIRGLQDQGRVVTTIDGARQNFQRAGHGSSGNVYIDPAFVRGIDIEKSAPSGVGGGASLGGTVNFRTIGADDLIKPGRRWGAELDLTTGTNEYDFSGSASFAARLTDSLSILGGISHINLGQAEVGKNGTLRYTNGELANIRSNPSRDTWSGIFKVEGEVNDDLNFSLGWLGYKSDFSETISNIEQPESVTNHTLTANLDWNPDSELIDLKARLWYTHTKNSEFRAARPMYPDMNVDYALGTFGGSLENTSRFELPFGSLAWNNGVEAFRDDGSTKASSTSGLDDRVDWSFRGNNPTGTRDFVSGFSNLTFERDWLTISGGLRYDYYNISGSTVVFGETVRTPREVTTIVEIPGYWTQIPDFLGGGQLWTPPRQEVRTTIVYDEHTPTYAQDVELSGTHLSPTFSVAVEPFEGLQLFGKYSQAYRPPTVMEAVVGGVVHAGGREVQAPNPHLRPEIADTWELGANILTNDVFQAGDSLRFKAVGFYREIDDYIATGRFSGSPDWGTTRGYFTNLNLDGTTHMRGVELEAAYDAGAYYVGAAFSYIDTDWASTFTHNGQSHEAGNYVLFVPPKTKLALDAGVRLFDRRLTLGGRATIVGAADQHLGLAGGQEALNVFKTEDYAVFDIYGSYAVTESATLRFAVNNLTDVAYVPALGADTYPAPGRTATVSLNLKF